MQKTSILLIGPESDNSSPEDQSFAARLAVGPDVTLHHQRFRRDVPDDLERQVAAWSGKVTGVVGTMRVPESQLLGELAERLNMVCFVANNNPSVWQQRRNVFHIGYPTGQTTGAVADALMRQTGRRRYLMLHDLTEFQTRVAIHPEMRLRDGGMDARCLAHDAEKPFTPDNGWKPDLIYVVFSSERKALKVIAAVRQSMPDVPLVLGRSLLRESFLQALRGQPGEFWFVDTNFRNGNRTNEQQTFMRTMTSHAIALPTTNHAFGWDCMTFCDASLKAGGGDPQRAIAWLETGVTLEGAGGGCSFTHDNHNGRHGFGPTVLTNLRHGMLREQRIDA